jgi:hypothetical protein
VLLFTGMRDAMNGWEGHRASMIFTEALVVAIA